MTKSEEPATWAGQRVPQKNDTRASNCLEYNTKAQSKQVAIPGTALAALLKRYRRDLLNCEESREVSQALDCVDGLLMLVEAKP